MLGSSTEVAKYYLLVLGSMSPVTTPLQWSCRTNEHFRVVPSEEDFCLPHPSLCIQKRPWRQLSKENAFVRALALTTQPHQNPTIYVR